MGQKVSPIGLRIGINRGWEANWYANNSDFSKYLENDLKIRKFLEKKLKDAGISTIEIERNAKRCEVIIHTSRPGVIIGKGGEEIENLKKEISKLVNEEIQISIVDIKKPDLDAKIVADSIAAQIENRASFRMAQKKAIRNVMKAGAKGVKTLVSGRLNGADIARSEHFIEWRVSLQTFRSDIDYHYLQAMTKYWVLWIKVRIQKGTQYTAKKKTKKDMMSLVTN